MAGIVERLVPDELWELFQRVFPEAPSRPQGGGRRRHPDREALAAIIFVETLLVRGFVAPAAVRARGLIELRPPAGESPADGPPEKHSRRKTS